ncbi:hypothetical protein [Peribacillus phoenicis]|uniref:hypothetical protein n=1 Tax=Peribacillus sp. 1P06PA-2 TaxID=3132295 RepID=UPI0039A454A3
MFDKKILYIKTTLNTCSQLSQMYRDSSRTTALAKWSLGKMFGNQLTEEQRQNRLMDARGIFKQMTDMYPNLKIKVSTEINPSYHIQEIHCPLR